MLFIIGIFLASAFFAFSQTKPRTESTPATEGEDAETMLAFLLSDKTRNLHQWSAISQFHGLPSDRVNAIEQTPDGIMWFGTDAGLAKFDGRRVQSVSPENFSNKRILALKTDNSGALWIGTEKGAFRYSENSFQPFAETMDYTINSILPPDPGLNNTDSLFLGAQQDSISKDFYILISKNKEGGFKVDLNPKTSPSFGNAIASVNGSARVTASAKDSDGNVWFGTYGSGVYLYRGNDFFRYTLENTAGGLRSNEILSIFVDRENVIWFGTTKGISRFDPNSPLSEQFAVGTNSNFIRTIYQAKDGKIYAGTQQGLFVSAAIGDWKPVAGFERRRIYAIAETEDGKLLLGTSRGLFVFPSTTAVKPIAVQTENPSNESEKQSPAGSIRAIQNFQDKIYLGVFGQGLAYFDGANFSTTGTNPPEILNVTSMKTVGDRLWIGTGESGAFFFDGKQFSTEPALESLKNRAIWAIESSPDGGIWFGTEKGLFLYKNGALSAINNDFDVRGLAIASDGNGVWCATEKNGLVRFAEDAVFGWIRSRFDIEQGLPSQKVFSIVRQSEDTFLIGTTRGIVRYKTPRTRPLLVPTRILSRRLHTSEELKSPIVLDYPQNTLTAEVSAINSRTFPEQFQYAFLLKDSKDALVRQKFGSDPQFLMDNLAAGDYTVEIRGFDKNLIASEPLVFSFKIEKAPFPWITLALTVLLLLALIALIWAILSQRKIFQKSSELKTANRELNAARMDLANEAERERRRISQDLHDQTLADLRHLQLLADKIPADGVQIENSKIIRREIENVSNEIRRICEDLSPSVLENIGFSAALEWALTNFAATNLRGEPIEREFISDENAEENLALAPAEQIQIYRIAQEVLSNISRHSAAAKVMMKLEIEAEKSFVLMIEDDGAGFDFESAAKRDGRGLSNIKSRAKLIEAEFSFDRSPTGGTIFTLKK